MFIETHKLLAMECHVLGRGGKKECSTSQMYDLEHTIGFLFFPWVFFVCLLGWFLVWDTLKNFQKATKETPSLSAKERRTSDST